MKTLTLAVLIGMLSTYSTKDDDVVLFNGKDLENWTAEGAKDFKNAEGKVIQVWTVRDGLLHCEGKGFGFLRYNKQEWSDFAFHVEYKMAAKCNSGIGIRTRDFDPKKSRDTRPSFYSYEIQLFDDGDKPPTVHSTGSLYRYVAPKVSAAKPPGEWNTMDIECRGPHIKVTLNEKLLIDVDQTTIEALKNKPLKGYVCLQNHGGTIDFRNVRIRDLQAHNKE